MIKIISYALKFIFVFVIGVPILGLLELLAVLLWDGKFMQLACDIADVLTNEIYKTK